MKFRIQHGKLKERMPLKYFENRLVGFPCLTYRMSVAIIRVIIYVDGAMVIVSFWNIIIRDFLFQRASSPLNPAGQRLNIVGHRGGELG